MSSYQLRNITAHFTTGHTLRRNEKSSPPYWEYPLSWDFLSSQATVPHHNRQYHWPTLTAQSEVAAPPFAVLLVPALLVLHVKLTNHAT
jgi:hypothetical protein